MAEHDVAVARPPDADPIVPRVVLVLDDLERDVALGAEIVSCRERDGLEGYVSGLVVELAFVDEEHGIPIGLLELGFSQGSEFTQVFGELQHR